MVWGNLGVEELEDQESKTKNPKSCGLQGHQWLGITMGNFWRVLGSLEV